MLSAYGTAKGCLIEFPAPGEPAVPPSRGAFSGADMTPARSRPLSWLGLYCRQFGCELDGFRYPKERKLGRVIDEPDNGRIGRLKKEDAPVFGGHVNGA
jgi:hypothetical protein